VPGRRHRLPPLASVPIPVSLPYTLPSTLDRGATVLPDGSVRFAVWAPKARTVAVRIAAPDGGSERTVELERIDEGDDEGLFTGQVADARGADYAYRLDGGDERPDPVSRWLPYGVHGRTRVVDPGGFRWTDDGWRGLAVADAVIYELHVGTFTPAGTFEAAIARLPYLRDLGVTAVELMPVAQNPGARNWGYDGVSLYAVQHSYGGPDGLRRLVDAAHRHGLAVLMDVVYNHLGPEGNYLGEFGPYFGHARTTWGEGLNLDGPDSDQVRRYLLQNARYWIDEYHCDGLRLDATDRIVDLGALHLLEELSTELHRRGRELGRAVLVIAESDANDPRYLRPPDAGGYGLDAQWSDDFHHAVHALLTGERQGYYADFGGGPATVAKAVAERFVNDGRRSPHRRRRHGRPATDIPAERFVVGIQNHDQVGNRARGDRLSTLVTPDRLRLAAALLLLGPYVPLLFMGEEYGETNPFLYFVDHGDPALLAAVREGRRREFAAFAWEGEVPDPAAPDTFERSKLDWRRLEQPEHARLLALYRDLLALRRQEPALRPGEAAVRVALDPPGAMTVRLDHPAAPLVACFNLSDRPRRAPRPDGTLDVALSTEEARYGGTGLSSGQGPELALAPWSAVLLRGAA
jgi:maltooligosyltrehalose trehalohydrolase